MIGSLLRRARRRPVSRPREAGTDPDAVAATDDDPAALAHRRLAGAAELRGTVAPDPWPVVPPDPFPEVTGALPEVDADQVTTEIMAGAILHHGALVIRGMLGAADRSRLTAGMDRTHAARATAGDHGAATDPWFLPFRPAEKTTGQNGKPHLIRLVDSPPMMEDVLATYRRLGLVDAISAYFGEPAVFTANKSVLRFLETPDLLPTDWHQDGRFMGPEVRSVNVWVTLTDCGTTAPALDVVPRRETEIAPTGNGASGFDWTIGDDVVRALAGDTPPVRLDLRAGDGVLFDHFLIHRTGYTDEMTDVRRAIECWFFAPSHVPWQYQPLLA